MSAKYEPLELEPPESANSSSSSSHRRSSSLPLGHITRSTSSTGNGSTITQRKALIIGSIVAIALYSLLTLLGGSTKSERDHFLQSQLTYPDRARDIYKQPGTLQFDRNDYRPAWRRARWIPLDRLKSLVEKGRNGLERDFHMYDAGSSSSYSSLSGSAGALREPDGFDLLEELHATLKDPDRLAAAESAPSTPQFTYLQNKTIIILGDGNDRNALDYSCTTLLSGTSELRRYLGDKPNLSDNTADNSVRETHLCKLPTFLKGTTIWNFMTYGILPNEDTFAKFLPEIKPREYLKRLEQIQLALKEIGIEEPDLIVVHSTLWDLAAINFEDAFINLPPSEMLTIARLVTYRDKLRTALLKIDELWPNARKLYRTLPVTKIDRGDWWMQFMLPGTQPFPRIPYAINKGHQLNTVTSQVLTEIGWPKWDYGHVMSGYVEDYEGSVHVGNVGKTMWMQMLLYYLKTDLRWF